ncbi:hypothetical protein MRB53_025544 [Persea americana]|uniref:Uncharacterized protein n=1 Tax=Persea americana TaxID=3435 RepID=A0ACC2LG87_PERAE|nr:hypothetical protein MRB53_025544 [Persea americana]
MGSCMYPVERGAYKLLSEIGNGVSAVVYKAQCLPLNSTVVAIKVIDLDRSRPNLLDDVRRETKAMSLLSHPNILTAHCSFTVGRHLWVVMPFMAAGSLHSILSSSFPLGLPEPSIALLLKHTLLALHYLHAQGLLHRDIKASNILLDSNGSIKLADFGVSASIYEPLSSAATFSPFFNDLVGTPYWMAPEVIHSHVGYGFKADIWSFGITALELAHGRPPLSHLPPSKSLVIRITNRFRLNHDDHYHHHQYQYLDDEDAKKKNKKNKKKFSKAFKDMVASCLVQDPSKRPSAEKLLKHPFFKTCKSPDHLVRHVLQGLPIIEERLKESPLHPPPPSSVDGDDDDDNGSGEVTKIRRISGWNFNEDVFELNPVFPCDKKEDPSPITSSFYSSSFLEGGGKDGDRKRDDRVKVKEEEKKKDDEIHEKGNEEEEVEEVGLLGWKSRTAETLGPELISLLNSLSLEKEMVMNLLESCRGEGMGIGDWEEEREQRLADMVGKLQRTVDGLTIQLKGESAKNAALEKELQGLKDKNLT